MKNIKSIINNHNKSVLKQNINKNQQQKCNCTKKDQCPLNGECLTSNIVYEANVTSKENKTQSKLYIGVSETPFKKRYANHKKSFNIIAYKNDTELSKEVWKIKNEGYTPKITWTIIRKCTPYNTKKRSCNLCLNEKLEIIVRNKDSLLNKRNELISKCRHANKHMLVRHDSND